MSRQDGTPLDALLEANRHRMVAARQADPGLFRELEAGQRSVALWIGCADSRVSETWLTGARPGTLFVHRNIAATVHPDDPSLQAFLQYGLEVLEIRHLVVCGHLGCGGLVASIDPATRDPARRWLAPVRDLWRRSGLADRQDLPLDERLDLLAVLHVRQQVESLRACPAVRSTRPELHGWLVDLSTGLLLDAASELERAGVHLSG